VNTIGKLTLKVYNIFTVQPWVRFWARVIDTFIIDTIVRITQLLFFPGSTFEPVLLTVGTYFIWALAEAKLISTWGTTPEVAAENKGEVQ